MIWKECETDDDNGVHATNQTPTYSNHLMTCANSPPDVIDPAWKRETQDIIY